MAVPGFQTRRMCGYGRDIANMRVGTLVTVGLMGYFAYWAYPKVVERVMPEEMRLDPEQREKAERRKRKQEKEEKEAE